MDKVCFAAQADDAGSRIDQWLATHIEDTTRSSLQKLCARGYVLVNGKAAAKNYKLRGTEQIEVLLPEPVSDDVVPQNIPVEIVYEDEDLLVVNKPKGMVVHPAPGHYDGTLVNALLHHCKGRLSGIGGVIRPGIVHRIDKDTSGLLMVAKTDFAHQSLAEQIKVHSFQRIYNAVVYGGFSQEQGSVDAPIGRSPHDRMKMCVTTKNARDALTYYEVQEAFGNFTHLQLKLETGRTHQIRVHMAYIGHPVAGDAVYGPKKVIVRLHGQCLHARTLGFVHPRTQEHLAFTSELPDYYTSFLGWLRKQSAKPPFCIPEKPEEGVNP